MSRSGVPVRRLLLVKRTSPYAEDGPTVYQYVIDEAADRAGVSRRTWLHYWRWGLADPNGVVDSNQRSFDEQAVYRVRRAEQVRKQLETNIRTAATIVRLMDHIERLQRDLEFYR